MGLRMGSRYPWWRCHGTVACVGAEEQCNRATGRPGEAVLQADEDAHRAESAVRARATRVPALTLLLLLRKKWSSSYAGNSMYWVLKAHTQTNWCWACLTSRSY